MGLVLPLSLILALTAAFSSLGDAYIVCSSTATPTLGRCNSRRHAISSDELDALLLKTSERSERFSVQPMFEELLGNEEFQREYWQRQPLLIRSQQPHLQGSFQMENVRKAVSEDFLEAGRGNFQEGRSGWNMAAVSKPRGKTFEEAKLRFEDITVAMQETSGTVVFNSAGGFIPELSLVCLETLNAFQLPVAMNVYLTNPQQRISAPPHTDKQDVFVLQTQGMKRWRVFRPPEPQRQYRADPFARGKATDVLTLSELDSEPLVDTVLTPGQVLYVPAGFPHTTDTLHIPDHSQPSVHLTLGIDTIIWGLNFAFLRAYCLRLAGMSDSIVLTKLPVTQYFRLHQALPVGFASHASTKVQEQSPSIAESVLIQTIRAQLIERMREIEPARFISLSNDQMQEQLHMDAAIRRTIAHYFQIVDIFARMYDDVGNKLSKAQMNISFFRSQPYFQKLERTMEDFVKWPDTYSRVNSASASNTKQAEETVDRRGAQSPKSKNSSVSKRRGFSSSKA